MVTKADKETKLGIVHKTKYKRQYKENTVQSPVEVTFTPAANSLYCRLPAVFNGGIPSKC